MKLLKNPFPHAAAIGATLAVITATDRWSAFAGLLATNLLWVKPRSHQGPDLRMQRDEMDDDEGLDDLTL